MPDPRDDLHHAEPAGVPDPARDVRMAPDPSADDETTPRPLVLLHGLGQSPIAWQDVVSALGAGRPLHAPWIRGLRPNDQGPCDIADATAALSQELELQGWRRVDLCGVSLGAMVALQLAIDEPDRVGRLVLSGGQAYIPRWAMRAQALAIRMIPGSRLRDLAVSKERMLVVYDGLASFDIRAQLGEIRAPALIVCGARDRANLAGSRQLAAGLPNARLQLVEGAGHQVNVERPAEFATLVRNFLDEA